MRITAAHSYVKRKKAKKQKRKKVKK